MKKAARRCLTQNGLGHLGSSGLIAQAVVGLVMLKLDAAGDGCTLLLNVVTMAGHEQERLRILG